MDSYLTYICLFLLFISRPSYGADVNSLVSDDIDTKNVVNLNYLNNKSNKSDYFDVKIEETQGRGLDTSVGRTFGRPFKKMIAALIPLVFQIGAASTWAVVAALVGVKTLMVTLVILKLLLVAGAAKMGALFAQKGHAHGHSWEPPNQKEIHLHIHNGHQSGHEEHVPLLSGWKQVPYTPPDRPGDNPYFIDAAPTPATRRILNIKL